ncbi:MAG: YCF48-related protein [Bacteroidota bacterium]
MLGSCQPPITPDPEPLTLPLQDEDQLRAIQFWDAQSGLAVGGQRFDEDVILRTDDGGANWKRIRPVRELKKMIFDLHIENEQSIWGTAMDGKLLQSKNGGMTWDLIQQAYWLPMHSIFSVTDSILVAVGGVGYSVGQIVRSTDAGQNWTLLDTTDFELRDVFFTDQQTGYACGYGVILKSTDAGLTWEFTEARRGFFSAMDWPTPRIGYVVGRAGTIIKTTDGGSQWQKLRNGNNPLLPYESYNEIKCWDENHLYIVGDKGILKYSDDGGNNWQRIELDTKVHLHGLYLTGPREGWVCGSEGFMSQFEW